MDRDQEFDAQRRLIKALGDTISKSELIMPACKFCKSTNVVKNGHRNGTQYWICKNCGHGFVDNKSVAGSRYPIDTISKAVYDYYGGMSLNTIREGIRQETGLNPSDSSVYGWLAKYTRIALDEAAKYPPKVSKKWVMDETVISLDGKKWWFITALDWDTRFLLAARASTNRNHKDIQSVLEESTTKTGTIPDEVLSDGWSGYPAAIELAYGADSKHIVSTPFTEADLSTNLMERWNGTLKDRLKPMRGMDRNSNFQLILEGFIFYYNYLRPHLSLKGKTPAEAAGVTYPFKSWGDVVRSEMPILEMTPEVRTAYRVMRKRIKARNQKKHRNKTKETPTSARGIRSR